MIKGKHIDTGASPVLGLGLPGVASSVGRWVGEAAKYPFSEEDTKSGEQATAGLIGAGGIFALLNEISKVKQAQSAKSRTFAHEDALAGKERQEARALRQEEGRKDRWERQYAPYLKVMEEGYTKLRGIGAATTGVNFRGHF